MASTSTEGEMTTTMLLMLITLISVRVTGIAIRQSQRSDKERLKMSRFLSRKFQ